jgi:hypothetical protein
VEAQVEFLQRFRGVASNGNDLRRGKHVQERDEERLAGDALSASVAAVGQWLAPFVGVKRKDIP